MKNFRKDILAEKKEKAKKVLKDSFETRDWQVLQGSHCDNMEEMVKWTTNFCMDTVVPVRSARCFASNKPWIMKDVDQQNEEGVGIRTITGCSFKRDEVKVRRKNQLKNFFNRFDHTIPLTPSNTVIPTPTILKAISNTKDCCSHVCRFSVVQVIVF